MKKTSLISLLVLSIVFLIAGCSAKAPEKEKVLIPEKVNSVKVTYERKKRKTTWNLKADNVKKWEDWAKSLTFEPKTFKKGKTPSVEKKGEGYTFNINNGEETFSYIDPDNCYILQNKKWYFVTTPSEPPVMEKRKNNEFMPLADSGEILSSTENYSFKMNLLKGWKCEPFFDDSRINSLKNLYALRIYPEGENEGNIAITYPGRYVLNGGHGVDHTGESQMTIAGEPATVKKTRESDPYWHRIGFNEKNLGVSIYNNQANQWLDSYSEEILEMLGTIEFAVKETNKNSGL